MIVGPVSLNFNAEFDITSGDLPLQKLIVYGHQQSGGSGATYRAESKMLTLMAVIPL